MVVRLALGGILLLVGITLFLSSQPSFVLADTRLHKRDDVTGHIPSTHEEIITRREEHKDLFSSRLDEVNAQLENHAREERLLTETEYYRLQRKKKAYENKLEELTRVFDERHSRRIMDREELLNDMTKSRIERATKVEL